LYPEQYDVRAGDALLSGVIVEYSDDHVSAAGGTSTSNSCQATRAPRFLLSNQIQGVDRQHCDYYTVTGQKISNPEKVFGREKKTMIPLLSTAGNASVSVALM
jgi:hypothetical protein